jgi:hypothetical protein
MGKSQLQWLEELKLSKKILDEASDNIARRRCAVQLEIEKEEASIAAKDAAEKVRVAPGAKILRFLTTYAGCDSRETMRELNALLGVVAAADNTQKALVNNHGEIAEAFKTFSCAICLNDCRVCTHREYEDVNAKEAMLAAVAVIRKIMNEYEEARAKLRT